jgi:hypothetical protein
VVARKQEGLEIPQPMVAQGLWKNFSALPQKSVDKRQGSAYNNGNK